MDSYLGKNEIFRKESCFNRDDIFDKYILLKNELEKFDCNVATSDINDPSDSDVVIYFDMPRVLPPLSRVKHSLLILRECSLIKPENYALKKHERFCKIFTWDETLLDNNKYYKLNFTQLFPLAIEKDLSGKTKLCTMVAGHKSSPKRDSRELYSHRKKAIRWFESNHLDEFDLYGMGWDKYDFSGSWVKKVLGRISAISMLISKLFFVGYPSYNGKIENKFDVMRKYRFSICYENATHMPGYITEKIFDSLFAGCIPVYWGDEEISKSIPKGCFIDKREFDNYEELYSFMKNMSDEEYINYLNCIQKFVEDERYGEFSTYHFSKIIAKQVLEM